MLLFQQANKKAYPPNNQQNCYNAIMATENMTSRQAIILMLGCQYIESQLDPILDDTALNLLGYLTDSAIAASAGEEHPNLDVQRLDVFGSLDGYAVRNLSIAGEFKVFEIIIPEETKETASAFLSENSEAEAVFKKISATIDGCEEISSLSLIRTMYDAVMFGNVKYSFDGSNSISEETPIFAFTDFQINFAIGRLTENGWISSEDFSDNIQEQG